MKIGSAPLPSPALLKGQLNQLAQPLAGTPRISRIRRLLGAARTPYRERLECSELLGMGETSISSVKVRFAPWCALPVARRGAPALRLAPALSDLGRGGPADLPGPASAGRDDRATADEERTPDSPGWAPEP